MPEPRLAVAGLGRRFGDQVAVTSMSFAVAAGEMLALIGPNGAGKSTTFNMVGGQIQPSTGQVRLDGQAITGLSPARIARLGVGRTFQVTSTFGSMTLRENVQMALLAARRAVWGAFTPMRGQRAEEADGLLAAVELGAQASRFAGVLAYGDLKRLELAMALAASPRLLLMDEPTAGMAPSERVALMQLTRRLATTRGISVLFTEHDMDVVFSTADRILVLNRGVLIAEGTGEAIRANPQVRDVYLGSGQTTRPSAPA